MGRVFAPQLRDVSEEEAAAGLCVALDEFQQGIGMWLSLEGLGVSQEDVLLIADHCQVLPDYKTTRVSPRVTRYWRSQAATGARTERHMSSDPLPSCA